MQGAAIRNGHLILTLTNGDELDAGNLGAVSGFRIDDSQHLIVAFQNGTTQDLGAIFSGNVNIDGNLTANSIIENMNGYSFTDMDIAGLTKTVKYVGAVKNGNKLTLSYFASFNRTESVASVVQLGNFFIPQNVADALIPENFSGLNMISIKEISVFDSLVTSAKINAVFAKHPAVTNSISLLAYNVNNLSANTNYLARIEVTFLLSASLVA